jgi:hypothetical protein
LERNAYPRGADFAFQKAFLLTYRSFMSPTELMEKLIFRYCVTPNMPKIDMSVKNERQIPIRLRCVALDFADFADGSAQGAERDEVLAGEPLLGL